MQKLRSLGRTRLAIVFFVGSILLWDSTAYAINAIVSQDLPLLTQIAATEVSSYLELGAILTEAAAITAQVKEYTTIAKTAWGALNELRYLSLDDLRDAAMRGASNAFPELQQIYGDAHDIADLSYRNQRAVDTVRGILWEEVYGPGIDYLHAGHSNLDAMANMQDHAARHEQILAARRAETTDWEATCRRTEGEGEGACQAAANRAAIQSALMLQDMHETSLYQLEAQRRLIANEDRKELDNLYAYDRFVYDMRNYISSETGVDAECVAGQCLYERYGDKMWKRVQEFRARHPSGYGARIVRRPLEMEEQP